MDVLRSTAHHVVPQPFGQLLVALDGEVKAVMSEERHVNPPALLRGTKQAASEV